MEDFSLLNKYAQSDAQALRNELTARFVERYGEAAEPLRFFAAPARINIIGEHIDYNGGRVFPAAIDRYIYLAIRKRDDAVVQYDDLRFPGTFRFNIKEDFSYKKENDYCNYLNGILSILKAKGFAMEQGFDALFFSCIPPGGGISSSSALECCFARAVSSLYGLGLDGVEIAKAGQESEHKFMNVQCGIMDQFIIAMGKKDAALLLDCATLDYEYVPLELGNCRFVVMNTNKKRQLSDSKYNERVGECKTALTLINEELARRGEAALPNLCACPPDLFESLKPSIKDDVLVRRVRHCVTENERVNAAVTALKAGNLEELGRLLDASHESLQKDYETTGIELDTLHEEANKIAGCLGSRVTGAGFGGCAIALIKEDCFEEFVQKVGQAYKEKIGYEAAFFECGTGFGAAELE